MARQSKTDHLWKICGCVKWKECAHPWYIRYYEGRDRRPDGTLRKRGLRQRLGPLVGREPVDYADAKTEARRAILAWQTGRDARLLLPDDAPTLEQVLDAYGARPDGTPIDVSQRSQIVKAIIQGRPFGAWRVGEITRDMIETFRRQRPRIAANRDLCVLRAAFNWAVLQGLMPATPFKIGNVAAIKLTREEARSRRLHPGESERLLAAANAYMRDLITAALETACRKGELLSLQWHQVRDDLSFPAGKTKTKKARRVPISSVLSRVLTARRNDPSGEPLPPHAYVFGDEIGRRRKSIKSAWDLARLGAAGHTPQWTRKKNCSSKLTPASRLALRELDLHFHDLRREGASRWLDGGVALTTIQKWLGHATLAQTATYLAATAGGDAESMRLFEQATGRLPRLPQIAPFSSTTHPKPVRAGRRGHENRPKDVTVH